jgi:tRNA-2-methylthio-N6-dimethylallyladenosine synthase
MNRGYTREWYLEKILKIRSILGEDCGISSDMIAGFCGETDEEHYDTLTLMDQVRFDFAYMFNYSERPGTLAEKKFKDDVPDSVKKSRLDQIIEKQREHSLQRNQRDVGKVHQILIEGFSRRSNEYLQGRNTANKVIVFPAMDLKKGDYVNVLVERCTGATLVGKVIA